MTKREKLNKLVELADGLVLTTPKHDINKFVWDDQQVYCRGLDYVYSVPTIMQVTLSAKQAYKFWSACLLHALDSKHNFPKLFYSNTVTMEFRSLLAKLNITIPATRINILNIRSLFYD